MRKSKAIIKYTIIHMVELVIAVFAMIFLSNLIGVSNWPTIIVIALLITKDLVVFPKVWIAYDVDDSTPMSKLIGLEATVMDSLDPVGYVRVVGELWKAEIKDPRSPAKRGDRARVIDTKGMTLIVERCNDRSIEAVPRLR